jgi:hypothetical protein
VGEGKSRAEFTIAIAIWRLAASMS